MKMSAPEPPSRNHPQEKDSSPGHKDGCVNNLQLRAVNPELSLNLTNLLAFGLITLRVIYIGYHNATERERIKGPMKLIVRHSYI